MHKDKKETCHYNMTPDSDEFIQDKTEISWQPKTL